jgi:hypothetical protein
VLARILKEVQKFLTVKYVLDFNVNKIYIIQEHILNLRIGFENANKKICGKE